MNPRTVLALLLVSTVGARAQLILNPGESYDHHFDTLWFSVHFFGEPQGGSSVMYFESFEPNSVVSCEMWESNIVGQPNYAYLITNGPPANTPTDVASFPNIWNDLEGTIRITVLTGSVTISRLGLGVFADIYDGPEADATYSDEFDLAARPPRLTSLPIANGLRLSWWTNGSAGYVLESAHQLNPSMWSAVTNIPTLIDKKMSSR